MRLICGWRGVHQWIVSDEVDMWLERGSSVGGK
jgi:hypothetical protein